MKARTPRFMSKVAIRYRKIRRELPATVSNIAVNEFKENFRRQGYRSDAGTVVRWKPRKHDKSSRAILVGKGSGRMKRAIKARPTFDTAKVVNTAPYSGVHNDGLPIKGNKLARDGFTKSGKPRFVRTNEPAKMPKRPFMKHTKPLSDDIEKELFDELEKIWR